MNQQINYIIYTILFLTVIGGGYWIFQKLPVDTAGITPIAKGVTSPGKQNIGLINSLATGKILFQSKCATCHNIFKDITGSSILGFEERGPWRDRKNVYEWIRNPEAFMKKNEYAKELKIKYGTTMTSFPDLTDGEIDAICDYINQAEQIKYQMPVADR